MGNHIKTVQEQREIATGNLEEAYRKHDDKKLEDMFANTNDEIKNYYEYIDKRNRL